MYLLQTTPYLYHYKEWLLYLRSTHKVGLTRVSSTTMIRTRHYRGINMSRLSDHQEAEQLATGEQREQVAWEQREYAAYYDSENKQAEVKETIAAPNY